MKRFAQCVYCNKNTPLRANSSGLLLSGLCQKRACIRSHLRVITSQIWVFAGFAGHRQHANARAAMVAAATGAQAESPYGPDKT